MDIKKDRYQFRLTFQTRDPGYETSINLTEKIMKPNFESTIC